MRVHRTFAAIAVCLAALAGCSSTSDPTWGRADSARLGSAGVSAARVRNRAVHRRAVEAVIWGMPAVNAQLMFDALAPANADFNQIVYWSRPVNWKDQTLTPNPDTIYLNPYYNTKDVGPIVLEIPPAMAAKYSGPR